MISRESKRVRTLSIVLGVGFYLLGAVLAVIFGIIFSNETSPELIRSVQKWIILLFMGLGIILIYFLSRGRKEDFENQKDLKKYTRINIVVGEIIPLALMLLDYIETEPII